MFGGSFVGSFVGSGGIMLTAIKRREFAVTLVGSSSGSTSVGIRAGLWGGVELLAKKTMHIHSLSLHFQICKQIVTNTK